MLTAPTCVERVDPEGLGQPGGVGLCETHKVQQGQVHWVKSKHKHRLGREWIESSCGEKVFRVYLEEKLSMDQQCALAAQKTMS